MTCLAATCELIQFPSSAAAAAAPVGALFRDVGGRGRGSSVSVRAVMTPPVDAVADRAEAERLMLEDPERWDGLS